MITLAITKNLLTECKAHLNYFSKHALAIVNVGLDAAAPQASRPRDLDISARAASTFYALAAFLDPSTMSVDDGFKQLLKSFAAIAVERPAGLPSVDQAVGEDLEHRNRIHLIGLGALAGATGSDAIFTANFNSYASVIVPALLENVKDTRVTLDWLTSESKKASDGKLSYSEFSVERKPISARRAHSISGVVAGEKGPFSEDVVSAALGVLQTLVRHGDAGHVQAIVTHAISWMDGKSALPIPAPADGRAAKSHWDNTEWSCWLAQSLGSWAAVQYRYVVLTTFVEHLVDVCEGQATQKHLSLIEMSRTMLTGQLSLFGLSTSDLLSSLAGLAVRRVYRDTRDSLLPPLVDCISGLGTHIYYADQINDIAEEISARIASLQLPDAAGNANGNAVAAGSTKGTADLNTHILRQRIANAGPEQRDESIRVLLFALMGVLHTTHQSSGEVKKAADAKQPAEAGTAQPNGTPAADDRKGKTSAAEAGIGRSGNRNRVSPLSMVPTASLLASANHGVRHAYLQTLVTLFRDEFEREQRSADAAATATLGEQVESSIGFLHALSAAIHVMALSKSLVAPQTLVNNVRESPLELLPHLERINLDPGRPGSLKSDSSNGATAGVDATAALPVDYAGVAAVLEEAAEAMPTASALAFTPMLLALDKDAGARLVVNGLASPAPGPNAGLEGQRRVSARVVVARAFVKLGDELPAPDLRMSGSTMLSQLPTLGSELGPAPAAGLTLPPEPVAFGASASPSATGESSASTAPLASRARILEAFPDTLDAAWLARDWSVSIAVDDALTSANPYASATPSIALAPPTPAIVIDQPQAKGKTANGTRANDLRDALSSNPAADVADRRASRRESRRVGADRILDSIKTDSSTSAAPVAPPYAA